MKEEYDFSQGKRGAVDPIANGKTRINTVLDDDILEWFRSQVHAAGGGNYQTLINNVLREHIQHNQALCEAQEKNNRDLDEVLETLEEITKTKARNYKILSSRNINILTKKKTQWNALAFSILTFLVVTKLAVNFNSKPLAYLALVILVFMTVFLISILYLTLIDVRNSSNLSQTDIIKNFMIQIEEEAVKNLNKKFSVLILKKAKRHIEVSLKKFQSRRKTFDSLLQIVILISVAFLILIFGEPVQQILERKFLYGIVTGIPGIVAVLILILKFIYAQNEESITNKYNEWLFILEEAQIIDNSKEINHV